MFSIENFYYILHRHLLEPLGIQDVMYLKFGSTDRADLMVGRYRPNHEKYGLAKWRIPTCYYCDQEPLTEKTVYQLEFIDAYCWVFKVLANSEISALKNKILKHTQYLDWYFFFHGFAALDWFRDAQYFDQQLPWTKPYINLNRLCVNERSYRLNLVARLTQCNVLHRGHVSLDLNSTPGHDLDQELFDPHSLLSASAKQMIKAHITHSMSLDQKHRTSGNLSADLGHREFELWKSGLWHLVTETVFYHSKLHLTEKIFKPIVAQRPFMLAAAPGNLAYLKSYGFKTFDQWIDESYDTISDPDQRLQAIVDQTAKICAMSDDQLRQMHEEMQPVLTHNFNHFYTGFRTQIVDELVNNFEKCARIWSNGRVDDRALPVEKVDFAQVKKILLR